MEATDANTAPTVRMQLVLSVPALLVGVVSASILYGLESLAGLLQTGIWSGLPKALGVNPASGWWIFGVLSLTGLAVGLVVWLMPGHGGRDSATTELIADPLRLAVLPSLIVVTVLALAGGVSLGPENPIIAINTGVLVAVIARLWPKVPTALVVMTSAAATIGALFGTPVAAALVFTGVVGAFKAGGAIWDRLFLPLVAAAAGSITMLMFDQSAGMALTLPAYTSVAPIDLLSCAVIAAVAALLGLAASVALPRAHSAFRMLRNPVLYITLGGVLLGVLGAIGGPITLFKGLSQMGQLVAQRADYGAGQLALIVAVKIVALVIAAAAGFRGGRIFPAVFIGVAIGLFASALIPGIPLAVAVSAGVLGMVLAVARDGWIAIFVATAVTGGIVVLPVLCIAVLPVWLLVSRAPRMIVVEPAEQVPAGAS
ncbi:ion channel protein [Rathayibacter soli]|uniref:ion channel protein n=1 Tax=Rathayibacter soli TaxID=3144168 RepID=UPI0027E475D0|nr:ion channel protein [Glaciibacter superstes]